MLIDADDDDDHDDRRRPPIAHDIFDKILIYYRPTVMMLCIPICKCRYINFRSGAFRN